MCFGTLAAHKRQAAAACHLYRQTLCDRLLTHTLECYSVSSNAASMPRCLQRCSAAPHCSRHSTARAPGARRFLKTTLLGRYQRRRHRPGLCSTTSTPGPLQAAVCRDLCAALASSGICVAARNVASASSPRARPPRSSRSVPNASGGLRGDRHRRESIYTSAARCRTCAHVPRANAARGPATARPSLFWVRAPRLRARPAG